VLSKAVWRLLIDAAVSLRRRFFLSLPLFRLIFPRVCAGAVPLLFVLGGVFLFSGRPRTFFSANTEGLQQALAQPCSSGLHRGHPLLPSFPLLKIFCSCRCPISLLFEAPQMARTHGVAFKAEEAESASARRYASSIPTCLASRMQTDSQTRRQFMGECVNAKGRRQRT
jgi:hypothetical protein